MIFVFYILAAVLIWLSFKSLHGGINYLNYFKRELANAPSTYAPFATVIASCKGLDEDLEANLSALVEQDYPSYEVIFVVDDERDAAVPVIEVLRTGSKGAIKCKLIVAPKAVDSSQKVENLREAILHENGIVKHIGHFAGPKLPLLMAIFITPLIFSVELISSLIRPFTLGVRLFANMFADEKIFSEITNLYPPITQIVVPLLLTALGTFVALVQTLVFTLLSMIYISEVTHVHAKPSRGAKLFLSGSIFGTILCSMGIEGLKNGFGPLSRASVTS